MIKFPKVHIAQSVLSRILDTADQLGISTGGAHQAKGAATPPPAADPSVPDPELAGAVIDAKVHTPPPEDVPPLEPPEVPPDDALAGILARGDNIISA